MCIDMCIDMCADMCTDMCADVCTDMCADVCTDMCAGMCTDMHLDMGAHVHRHVQTCRIVEECHRCFSRVHASACMLPHLHIRVRQQHQRNCDGGHRSIDHAHVPEIPKRKRGLLDWEVAVGVVFDTVARSMKPSLTRQCPFDDLEPCLANALLTIWSHAWPVDR